MSVDALNSPLIPLQVRFWPALGRMRVAVAGELDLATSTRLTDEGLRLVDEGWDIELDLSELTFADLAGFEAITAVRDRASERGCEVVMIAPSAPVRQIAGVVAGFGADGVTGVASDISAAAE